LDRLVAYRCKRCGDSSLPRRVRCRRCRGREFEEVELGVGKLLTFTKVTATRPGYPSPLTLGLAEFEDGVKLLAQIHDPSPEVGMEVLPAKTNSLKTDGTRTEGFILTRAKQ